MDRPQSVDQASYKLNGGSGKSDQDIQVILLDERYYRDTLPCSVRNDWWVETTCYHSNAEQVVACLSVQVVS